jgi:hypothetical protein
MRVSHESPLDLLQKSLNYNDYDYSLLHLMGIPEYKKFYKQQSKNRYQILDNSAFEYQFLDEDFDIDYFIDVINEIQPSSIIVPDVIGDCEGTIQAFKDFPYHKINYNPEIIGVIQGKNETSLKKCANFMIDYADKLAVVFHSPAYQLSTMSESKDYKNMVGRYNFVNWLKTQTDMPIHLLGCSLPQEFGMYNRGDIDTIDTIDTANPIQFGMLGVLYPDNIGEVNNKPKYLMDMENILKPTPPEYLKKIQYNINKFKEII